MTNTDTTLAAGVAWLRELAGTCKDEAQQWFDRSCEDEGQEWRVRGESYAFIADQIERGHSPFTALTKPAVKCGDGGAPLCSACSAPITELAQEPGCGGPLAALTQSPTCCADEREPRQENTIRALEEAAIDLWEQSPEIAKINPWVRCEWSEVSERSRIYWRGLALTTAIRSNSHD